LVLSCKKERPADTATTPATGPAVTTTTNGQSTTAPQEEGAVIPEAFNPDRKRTTTSGFVQNPTNTHEKVASRFINRVKRIVDLSEEQQLQILEFTKAFDENTLKGKSGQANRQTIKKRAYEEIFTDAQRATIDKLGLDLGK